tara:strand:- start:224 stop:436 length:213 start_codon:yes stop_codon:yes gene_type:complete
MDKEKREIWMDYIRRNRVMLEKALDMYDEAWYNVRNQMAEMGVETTPMELEELTELIKDTLQILDEEEND